MGDPVSDSPLCALLRLTGQVANELFRYYQSSSCAVRSAVICYTLSHQFVFPTSYLKSGENNLTLSLPYNATDYESAVLPRSVYVQYDALRLEVNTNRTWGAGHWSRGIES